MTTTVSARKEDKIAMFTCMICGSRCSLEDRGKYWRWCGEHGKGGSAHGVIDLILRGLGLRAYKEHYYEN